MKLWQEAGVDRKGLKMMLVLHEKINKTQNFFSKQGMRTTTAVSVFGFNIRKAHAAQIESLLSLALANPLGIPNAVTMKWMKGRKQNKI